MTKKVSLLFLMFIIFVSANIYAGGLPEIVYPTTEDGLEYVIKTDYTNEKYVSIVGKGDSGMIDIIIPEKIKAYDGQEYKVREIDELAFGSNTSLRSIVLPKTIKYIHSCAFSYVFNVREIIIPEGIEWIDGYAFSGWTKNQVIKFEGEIDESKFSDDWKNGCEALILENAKKFEDVSINKWYSTAVTYCYNNKIILGTTDATFDPNMNLTRGMLVTILHRMEGSPKVNVTNKFSDVASDKWYTEAIKWATKCGIVHGYDGQGKFGPNDNITREQLAVILNNYATYKGKTGTVTDGLSKFPDSNEVSNWAREGVKWAVGRGIINGSQGKIVPKGTATRAEAASMIYNYCTKVK